MKEQRRVGVLVIATLFEYNSKTFVEKKLRVKKVITLRNRKTYIHCFP